MTTTTTHTVTCRICGCRDTVTTAQRTCRNCGAGKPMLRVVTAEDKAHAARVLAPANGGAWAAVCKCGWYMTAPASKRARQDAAEHNALSV